MRYGPAFENIAWSSLFLLAPLGCIYYPIEILPELLQALARILPLVYIFEEARSILVNQYVDYSNIKNAFLLKQLQRHEDLIRLEGIGQFDLLNVLAPEVFEKKGL